MLSPIKTSSRILARPDQQEVPGEKRLRYQAVHRSSYPFCDRPDILNPCTRWVVRYPSLYKIRTYQHNSFHLHLQVVLPGFDLLHTDSLSQLSSWSLWALIRNQTSDRAWCGSCRWSLGAQMVCMYELVCNSTVCVFRADFSVFSIMKSIPFWPEVKGEINEIKESANARGIDRVTVE